MGVMLYRRPLLWITTIASAIACPNRSATMPFMRTTPAGTWRRRKRANFQATSGVSDEKATCNRSRYQRETGLGCSDGRGRETHRHERILGKMVAFRRAIAVCVPAVCVIRVITHIGMPCLAVTIITACL